MSNFVQFLVVFLVALLAAVKVTLQGFASRRYLHTLQDSMWFNVLLFGTIAILFAVLFPMGEVDGTILAFGLLLGVSNVVSQASYAFAFNAGPVSLTVLIASFNVFISALFSAIFFKERVYLSQLCGIVLLLASMILSRASNPDEKKATRKWFLLTMVVMISFGFGNTAQKMFWITESSRLPFSDTSLMIVMYVAATLCALVMWLVMRAAGVGEKGEARFQKPLLGYVLAIGAALTAFQKVNMFALERIDGTFLFPTMAGVQSILVSLTGMLLFHDRLTRRQQIGMVCGIVCIALMNLRLGPSFTL